MWFWVIWAVFGYIANYVDNFSNLSLLDYIPSTQGEWSRQTCSPLTKIGQWFVHVKLALCYLQQCETWAAIKLKYSPMWCDYWCFLFHCLFFLFTYLILLLVHLSALRPNFLCIWIITIIGLGYVYTSWSRFHENHDKLGYVCASRLPVSHMAASGAELISYGQIIVLLWLLFTYTTGEAPQKFKWTKQLTT